MGSLKLLELTNDTETKACSNEILRVTLPFVK